MLTAPDRFVIVPIEDAREQWVAKDAMLRTLLASGAAALTAADLNTGAAVGWRDGEDPDALARRIAERVPGVNVQIPSELSQLLRSSTAFFSALLVGIAALGLVIGGLSLANTVAAAVFERLRDFGVKRALGATDLQLGGEVLGEALARDAVRRRRRHRRWRSLLGLAIDGWAGAHGPAALPLLGAACWAARSSSPCCSARRRPALRDAARRAAVAGRGDPPGRLSCSGRRAGEGVPALAAGAPIRVLAGVDLNVPAGRARVGRWAPRARARARSSTCWGCWRSPTRGRCGSAASA